MTDTSTSQADAASSSADRHGDLPEVPEATGVTSSATTPEDVNEAMKDVVDPELGINVVDLGLVYGSTSTSTPMWCST